MTVDASIALLPLSGIIDDDINWSQEKPQEPKIGGQMTFFHQIGVEIREENPKLPIENCLCERSEAISVYFDEIATHPMGARDDRYSVFLTAILGGKPGVYSMPGIVLDYLLPPSQRA